MIVLLMATNIIPITWSSFKEAVDSIEEQLVAVGFAPEVIIGVARGGLPLAVTLCHRLKISIDGFGVISVKRHSTDDVKAHLDKPILLGRMTPTDLRQKKVLVAEDTVGTGMTINSIVELLEAWGVTDCRVACLFQDQASVHTVPVHAVSSGLRRITNRSVGSRRAKKSRLSLR